jgi:arylsulfatase A-like enzyme
VGAKKEENNINKLGLEQYRSMLAKPIIEGPKQVGFDIYHGLSASLDMPPFVYIANDTFTHHKETVKTPAKFPARKGVMTKGFDLYEVLPTLVSRSKDFLHTHINDDTPVFLFLSLTSPHTPIVPSARFQGKSSLGLYGDFVMETDDAVGQIVATLTELNALDNTLLIFTSDNGYTATGLLGPTALRQPHNGNGIYRGFKSDIWEGGHRIPFVAQWPQRIRPNTVNYTPITLVDLFATFADISGQSLVPKVNYGEDSVSLLPLLLEESPMTQEALHANRFNDAYARKQFIVHSIKGCFGIREANYLMAFCGGSGGTVSIT